jgi:hypothetical protein
MSENTGVVGVVKKIQRRRLIHMLNAALDAKAFRFGRQAALAWLAAYPGDLEVTAYQAEFLLADDKANQGVSILERLIEKDPECIQAYEILGRHAYRTDEKRFKLAISALFALGSPVPEEYPVADWGKCYRKTKELIAQGDLVRAEDTLHAALGNDDTPLLIPVLHLELTRLQKDEQSFSRLAELYLSQHPECLPFQLFQADALMEAGNETEAVRLLHQCMSMDAAGQVVERLWGKDHPYRSIWPENLAIFFDLPVPVDVATRLGENWLPAGMMAAIDPAPAGSITLVVNQDTESSELRPESPADEVTQPVAVAAPQPEAAPVEAVAQGEPAPDTSSQPVENEKTAKVSTKSLNESVEYEFEKVAKRLKRPVIGRADGRYPVYVLFSTKNGLDKQYGPQTRGVIDLELRRLGEALRKRTGWEILVYYPDDPQCTAPLGLQPVTELDPWKLKLALADLDKALAKKGEMIGMLLIVGGPEVVPFHHLPNPADDYDEKIASDNPYATLDSNYFVPEWPVGRLPGEFGPDAGLLLEELRYLVAHHHQSRGLFGATPGSIFWPLVSLVESIFRSLTTKKEKPNSGYTAAVWRRASLAVFKPVGSPSNIFVSPPVVSGKVDVERLLGPDLGYYNLHGMEDSGDWYGQRDPSEPSQGPDYPVALSPKELRRNGHSPRMIFSEACYGSNILNKFEESAMSLKFLSLGSLVMVGSTCIAYGSVNTPLVAADLLGNYFWQQVKSGKTAGEAFMSAKIEMVREMIRRQGFLDAEDQKTLLSFVLYGDPMIGLETGMKRGKSILRLKKHPTVKVVEDKPIEESLRPPVSAEVIDQVKHSLVSYLPGVDTAEIHIAMQETNGNGAGAREIKNMKDGKRYVVTLSKQVPGARSVHRHYARATLDKDGKVIKLTVSR